MCSFAISTSPGPIPTPQMGEFHRPETHLIPLALDAVRGRRDLLTVFGQDYPTPDGTCVRDYVHVTDLVAAHVLGLDYLLRGGAPSVFNLGTGRGFSVREVVEAVARVTGEPVPAVDGPRRAGRLRGAGLWLGAGRRGAGLAPRGQPRGHDLHRLGMAPARRLQPLAAAGCTGAQSSDWPAKSTQEIGVAPYAPPRPCIPCRPRKGRARVTQGDFSQAGPCHESSDDRHGLCRPGVWGVFFGLWSRCRLCRQDSGQDRQA